MHLVTKQVKGHEYFYLVEKGRRGPRVVTTKTIYVGDRKKLSAMLQLSAQASLPSSFDPQPVGAALALGVVAKELRIADLIDEVCPVRQGASSVGERMVVAAIHRVLAPRGENGLRNVAAFFQGSVLADLFGVSPSALDHRRMCEMLGDISTKELDAIEAAVVKRLLECEGISTQALGFDCTNFDSYAGARTRSRLLQRGHAKSGRPVRVLGMGLLATADEGMPLLTFTYPGNENDVTAFKRFLRALDRRRQSLPLALATTVTADGGNVSKQLLLHLEEDPRHYVLRLPPRHLPDLERCRRSELPPLMGSLKGKVWAQKHECDVYGVRRCVLDVYSRRMHLRQLPGLQRDRHRARSELLHLQNLLDRQRQGLRRVKPLTVRSLRRRVAAALAREHMTTLFRVEIVKGDVAPTLVIEESPGAWAHLQDSVLGRTLLVTDRADWTSEQIVLASRVQSHNERLFRDLKDPDGPSMLPLRHRRDQTLRSHACVVVLGLMLTKVLWRRARRAGVQAPSIASVLRPLKQVQRARMHFPDDAPPALRGLALKTWVPSGRTPQQRAILEALGLAERPELGTTLLERLAAKNKPHTQKTAA